MDKQFVVEPFEYDGEDESARDFRGGRGFTRQRPGAVGRTLWQRSTRNPFRRPAARSRRRRRFRSVRFPYIPFPSVAGCSCDAPAPAPEPVMEPPMLAPVPVDGAAIADGAAEPADQELDQLDLSWNDTAAGFRARKRRRAAERGLPGPLPRAFGSPTRSLRLDAEAADTDTSTGAVPRRLGTLTVVAPGRHRFSYAFTPEDLLWTARFLVGEAGGADNADNAAVLWAMFNRYGLFTHTHYPTFHQFLRAYSTPLQRVLRNPGAARRHMNKPAFVKTGGNYPDTDIPRGQLRRFLELQRRPWDKLPAAARALATRAIRGEVVNPIGNASEFASTTVYYRDRHGNNAPLDDATWRTFTERYAASKGWKWVSRVPGLNQRGNAFFVDQRAAALPAGAVRVSL